MGLNEVDIMYGLNGSGAVYAYHKGPIILNESEGDGLHATVTEFGNGSGVAIQIPYFTDERPYRKILAATKVYDEGWDAEVIDVGRGQYVTIERLSGVDIDLKTTLVPVEAMFKDAAADELENLLTLNALDNNSLKFEWK